MEDENVKVQIQAMLNCEPEEFYKKYKKYKKAEAEFKELFEPFKEKLIQLHELDTTVPSAVQVQGMKLIYVSPSTRSTIDSKKLKEEEPELAKKYTKITNVAATIRVEEI